MVKDATKAGMGIGGALILVLIAFGMAKREPAVEAAPAPEEPIVEGASSEEVAELIEAGKVETEEYYQAMGYAGEVARANTRALYVPDAPTHTQESIQGHAGTGVKMDGTRAERTLAQADPTQAGEAIASAAMAIVEVNRTAPYYQVPTAGMTRTEYLLSPYSTASRESSIRQIAADLKISTQAAEAVYSAKR